MDIAEATITQYLRARRMDLHIKRVFDVAVAGSIVILIWPLLAAAAVAIMLDSKGPVFFRQERIGLGGRVFRMLKFRSMAACNTGSVEAEGMAPGTVVKQRDDPRVTKVGRWLRRTSIDELPQLFNVLRGDMSLVGPRPLPLVMAAPYPDFMAVRNLVRPGITGLFQLHARDRGENAQFMVKWDLEYLGQFSLWLDLRILAATPWAVLSGRGAY